MPIVLPDWLVQLRCSEIVERVQNDSRTTTGVLLGVTPNVVQNEVICGGQAEFDEPWNDLSPDDRVLLYAYFNQLGHLEELTEAFRMLFGSTQPDENLIIVDLGCGPFTGGLALTSALNPGSRFDYIGVDRSQAMRNLGKQLASAAQKLNDTVHVNHHWYADISEVTWDSAPGWRPMFFIISYLFASQTLDVGNLIEGMGKLLEKFGHGRATVLYTNSTRINANTNFPRFGKALLDMGFQKFEDGEGMIEIQRSSGAKTRGIRYALFYRPEQRSLSLKGN